jgi:hypothetical protein
MTQTAFNRDGILSPEERLASARKCLNLLATEVGGMGEFEAEFVENMQERIDRYGVTERQLAWLRDLVTKYAA